MLSMNIPATMHHPQQNQVPPQQPPPQVQAPSLYASNSFGSSSSPPSNVNLQLQQAAPLSSPSYQFPSPRQGGEKRGRNGRPSLSRDKMGLLRWSILIPTKFGLGEAQCSVVEEPIFPLFFSIRFFRQNRAFVDDRMAKSGHKRMGCVSQTDHSYHPVCSSSMYERYSRFEVRTVS